MHKISRISIFLLLILISIWPFSTVSAQDETPQIRITQVDNSKFPQVTVYVSVTNAAGEPVGIDPSAIQIFENGQLMKPIDVVGNGANVSNTGNQTAVSTVTTLLVTDVSGSMEKSGKLDGAKAAATAYVKNMRPGDQAGLIIFNTQVVTAQPITGDQDALIRAIDSMKPVGNTAMFDAVLEAVHQLDAISGRKAIILLSDGLDNRSKSNVDGVVQAIGPSGLSIITIGLGDPNQTGNAGIDEAALRSLAERTGGTYSYATAPAALQNVYEQQGRVLQSEYQITYLSPSALRDGINRNLTVSLTGGVASVESKYNPGGVLPEVSGQSSWALFLIILLGLLVLLFVPTLVNLGVQSLSGVRRKAGAGASIGSSHPARGRIKVK